MIMEMSPSAAIASLQAWYRTCNHSQIVDELVLVILMPESSNAMVLCVSSGTILMTNFGCASCARLPGKLHVIVVFAAHTDLVRHQVC